MFHQDTVYAEVTAEDDCLDPETAPGKIWSLVRPGQRVLDVGCGAGRLARHLREKGAVVTGIERHPEAAKRARRYCERVVEADLERPPFLDAGDRFDVIICADVLEHLAYPDAALRALSPHVAPGGSFLISLPNVAHYKIRWRLLRGRFDYEPWGIMDQSHLRFFTRKSARELLESCALRAEVVDAVYGVPLGRLRRYWARMPEVVGRLAPELFAIQWIFRAETR
jgi:2-polyprenyl-3-methyl-5-hydroxy-6-metoxy-1,4-benzoquinol methylase